MQWVRCNMIPARLRDLIPFEVDLLVGGACNTNRVYSRGVGTNQSLLPAPSSPRPFSRGDLHLEWTTPTQKAQEPDIQPKGILGGSPLGHHRG